jgi:hypothetical protein
MLTARRRTIRRVCSSCSVLSFLPAGNLHFSPLAGRQIRQNRALHVVLHDRIPLKSACFWPILGYDMSVFSREDAAAQSAALLALEGLSSSADVDALMDAWAAGTVSDDVLVEAEGRILAGASVSDLLEARVQAA